MTSFDNTHLLILCSFTFLEQEKKRSLVEVQKVLVAALLICSLKMGFYLFFSCQQLGFEFTAGQVKALKEEMASNLSKSPN